MDDWRNGIFGAIGAAGVTQAACARDAGRSRPIGRSIEDNALRAVLPTTGEQGAALPVCAGPGGAGAWCLYPPPAPAIA